MASTTHNRSFNSPPRSFARGFLHNQNFKKMNFYDLISVSGTVMHNGLEVPAQVTAAPSGRNKPVIERLEVATFDSAGNYSGSLMIYDDGNAESEIEKNGICHPF
jgi:hypothetical protein